MTRYVALGDSFAAGVGAGARANPCHQSDLGYPPLVATALAADLVYASCNNARISHVLHAQIGALTPTTTHVSVTVGGNDVSFAWLLTLGAMPGWMADGEAAIEAALVDLHGQLPLRLDALCAEIRHRAPEAHVVLTDYPRLFNGVDCHVLTFFTQAEMARFNEAADEISGVLAAAAQRHGFTFASVLDEFAGHAGCSAEPWIRGLGLPVTDSFHPNTAGHAAYARVVSRAFDVELTPPLTPSPARRRTQPGARRRPSPGFAVPDLLSPESIAGGRAYGLDVDRVVELARQLPSAEEVIARRVDLRVAVERGSRRCPGRPKPRSRRWRRMRRRPRRCGSCAG